MIDADTDADADAVTHSLHTSECTIVPRTVIFSMTRAVHLFPYIETCFFPKKFVFLPLSFYHVPEIWNLLIATFQQVNSLGIIHMNLMLSTFTIFPFQGGEEFVVKEKEQEQSLHHRKIFSPNETMCNLESVLILIFSCPQTAQ